MDTTILNLISVLISATGIFGAFTSFSAPEINKSYFGANPFKVKADIIGTTYTWLFAILAVIGLFIQVARDIFFYDFPARSHSTSHYICFLCFGLAAMAALAWALVMVGRIVTKRFWLPKMIESQRESYQAAHFIYTNDGWAEKNIDKQNKYDNPDTIKAANYENADKYIMHICNLLEMKVDKSEPSALLKQLQPYFE